VRGIMSDAYRRATQRSRSRTPLVLGVAALLGGVGVVAAVIAKWRGDMAGQNLMDVDRPLTGSQIQRGAFLNSGSKDVGCVQRRRARRREHGPSYADPARHAHSRDPDWDPVTRTYTGRAYRAYPQDEMRRRLGDPSVPMTAPADAPAREG
jgi:hypothetical protein